MNAQVHSQSLTDALHAEARLLSELTGVMRGQRDAVARDDLDGLDHAVFATHRLLLTLGEARRRRRALNEFNGEANDLSLEALNASFAGAPPPEVAAAMATLAETAGTLHREVEVNRRVLRHAIESGGNLIRNLCGASAPPDTYEPGLRQGATIGAVLLDRTI